MKRLIAEYGGAGALLGSGLAFGDQFIWPLLWIGILLGGTVGCLIGAAIATFRRVRSHRDGRV